MFHNFIPVLGWVVDVVGTAVAGEGVWKEPNTSNPPVEVVVSWPVEPEVTVVGGEKEAKPASLLLVEGVVLKALKGSNDELGPPVLLGTVKLLPTRVRHVIRRREGRRGEGRRGERKGVGGGKRRRRRERGEAY